MGKSEVLSFIKFWGPPHCQTNPILQRGGGTISGWWCNHHLEKYESMGRMTSHILWNIKHVWNHQPVILTIMIDPDVIDWPVRCLFKIRPCRPFGLGSTLPPSNMRSPCSTPPEICEECVICSPPSRRTWARARARGIRWGIRHEIQWDQWPESLDVPSGKVTVCYGKSQSLIGKSTISMGHFQ